MMQSTCVEKRRLGRIFRNYMTVMKHPILNNPWLGGASELRQTVGDCAESMPVVFSKSIMWKQSRVISISVSPRHTATNPAMPRSELEHRACPNCCLINSVLLEDHGIRVYDLVHAPWTKTFCGLHCLSLERMEKFFVVLSGPKGCKLLKIRTPGDRTHIYPPPTASLTTP
jgi:hypothetical protein